MVAYKRVLLKLSGEALSGKEGHGIDPEVVGAICDKVKEITVVKGNIANRQLAVKGKEGSKGKAGNGENLNCYKVYSVENNAVFIKVVPL